MFLFEDIYLCRERQYRKPPCLVEHVVEELLENPMINDGVTSMCWFQKDPLCQHRGAAYFGCSNYNLPL